MLGPTMQLFVWQGRSLGRAKLLNTDSITFKNLSPAGSGAVSSAERWFGEG